MAKRIHKEKGVKLDAIISSTAKRALTTAKFFAEAFDIKQKHFIEWPQLYEDSIDNYYNAVTSLNDDFTKVALFAHNPGTTNFSNELTNVRIDDMPTCAVFALRVNTDSWKDFKNAEKEFWFFDYPKNTV